jgi:hypothetical protein
MSLLHLSFSLILIVMGPSSVMAAPIDDECRFIREKISSLPSSGGKVVIPQGIYTCLAPIVIDRSNVQIRGQGAVTLRLGNRVNAPVLVMGDAATPPRPLRDIQVVNLKIDGNRWYQTHECWGGPCDGGGTAFIRNNGITVRAVTNGRIQDVYITSARSGGVVTEKGCYDLEIENLTAVDNEFDGFAGYETVGARLTRLNLSHNRAAGISLDIRFHGNFFNDVRMDHNGDVGIFMRDSNANIFENVSISDSGSHGVFLAQADGIATCSLGNEFKNLSVLRARGVGFRLNDSCAGNRLTGSATFLQNRDGCISSPDGAQLEISAQVLCKD